MSAKAGPKRLLNLLHDQVVEHYGDGKSEKLIQWHDFGMEPAGARRPLQLLLSDFGQSSGTSNN